MSTSWSATRGHLDVAIAGQEVARARDQLFIGGEWVTAAGRDAIEVVSPVSESVIATLPSPGEAEVDRAVAAARMAFDKGPWPRLTVEERVDADGGLIPHLSARLARFVG